MEGYPEVFAQWEKRMSADEVHWLKLELSVEIIGDMIAYYVAQCHKELAAKPRNHELIKELDEKILSLAEERELCYSEDRQEEMFVKVFTSYAPFLKSNSQSRLDHLKQ